MTGNVTLSDGVLLLWSFRFQMKFYFICQLGYWLHSIPELYFQKTKKVSVCLCSILYSGFCLHPEALSCLTSLVVLHCFKDSYSLLIYMQSHTVINILASLFVFPVLFRRIFHVSLCIYPSTWSTLQAPTFWSKSCLFKRIQNEGVVLISCSNEDSLLCVFQSEPSGSGPACAALLCRAAVPRFSPRLLQQREQTDWVSSYAQNQWFKSHFLFLRNI